ncbi:MAG TPA: metalloregulator ArsR/SmtB family transcription factor [Burkholderiaceae bacterium]
MKTSLHTGLHAIADQTRLAILQRLAQQPLAVAELARGFSVSRPAVSQHLKVLKDAGLVNDRQQGTQRIYQIDPAGIEALKAHFDRLWSNVLDNFQVAAEEGPQLKIGEEKKDDRKRK